MDNINDYYIDYLDLSELQNFFIENGEVRKYNRKEYFIRQLEKKEILGFVSDGIFRHTRIDSAGNEHVVGYSPVNHFVGDYTACLCNRESLISIQAVKKSTVYIIPYSKLETFFKSSHTQQRLGKMLAEQLFVMSYKRLIDQYCSTPEERYNSFIELYPELKEQIPLKEIASFIGVTPETVSHIRRKSQKS